MIMVALAVVVVVGLILYLLSVPSYYELKLARAMERGDGVSSQDHQVEGEVKMGLEYASNWRVNHWGTNFLAVRINCSFIVLRSLSSSLTYIYLLLSH